MKDNEILCRLASRIFDVDKVKIESRLPETLKVGDHIIITPGCYDDIPSVLCKVTKIQPPTENQLRVAKVNRFAKPYYTVTATAATATPYKANSQFLYMPEVDWALDIDKTVEVVTADNK